MISPHVPVKLRFQTARVIFALMMREMSTTHGRSPGGYLWAILEPTLTVLFLTFIFTIFTRHPPLGTNFPLFYATGFLPFHLYGELSGKTAQAIRFSRPLLAYPRVTFVDAVIARALMALITNVIVWYILLIGIVMLYDLSPSIRFQSIAGALLLSAFLGFAIGAINSLLFAFFPIWERLWAIVSRPLLIVSCIFYLYESLPENFQNLLWFNPIAHLVGMMRAGFYAEYQPTYISVPYLLLWCTSLSTLGVFFLRFYHRKIMNEV